MIHQINVFSAHAEVVPTASESMRTPYGILRARGGSSDHLADAQRNFKYSPRTRR